MNAWSYKVVPCANITANSTNFYRDDDMPKALAQWDLLENKWDPEDASHEFDGCGYLGQKDTISVKIFGSGANGCGNTVHITTFLIIFGILLSLIIILILVFVIMKRRKDREEA